MQLLLSPGASGIVQSMLGVITFVHAAEASGAVEPAPSATTAASSLPTPLEGPAELSASSDGWPDVLGGETPLPPLPEDSLWLPLEAALLLPLEPIAPDPASFPETDAEPQAASQINAPIRASAATHLTTTTEPFRCVIGSPSGRLASTFAFAMMRALAGGVTSASR
jgi:hypothetical protein